MGDFFGKDLFYRNIMLILQKNCFNSFYYFIFLVANGSENPNKIHKGIEARSFSYISFKIVFIYLLLIMDLIVSKYKGFI